MTFSAQLMNGFWITFKSLVIFTPHFPAILENRETAWKTPAPLHFCHLENPAPFPPNHSSGQSSAIVTPVVFRAARRRERCVTVLSDLR
ncbi:hypothetical protein [Rhizobium sp. TBD182]|uniref:hypothetical protein n=1 Tax=Rhizobium sp. TBD182 TaxID=1560230 RepID=UPI001AECB6C3|nr:hypothetical protein [Rhizobium sp. TBD182]